MDLESLKYEDLSAEEAIPLITVDDVKKGTSNSLAQSNLFSAEFVVNQEAIEFLKTVEAPLGVVAVAGNYRTGKSYLLNRVLLKRNSGFGVGNTVNACTKVSSTFIFRINR